MNYDSSIYQTNVETNKQIVLTTYHVTVLVFRISLCMNVCCVCKSMFTTFMTTGNTNNIAIERLASIITYWL